MFVYLLAMEVTPGLLAGAEPDAHQFNVTICLKGDQMEENSEQYRLNSKPDQACMTSEVLINFKQWVVVKG
jgi:hypothetical protein